MKRKLNDRQLARKKFLLEDARNAYQGIEEEAFFDFSDEMEWRLVEIADSIIIQEHKGAFEPGDVTIGRKETKVTSLAWVYLYSFRLHRRFKITVANPLIFLED